MRSLPPEVLLIILSLLDPPSLARSRQVCRRWQHLARDEKVWQEIAIQRAYTTHGDALRGSLKTIGDAHTPSSAFNLLEPLPSSTQDLIRSRYRDDVHQDAKIDDRNALRDISGYFANVSSYEELCKRKWCLDRAWQSSQGMKETIAMADSGEQFTVPQCLRPIKRSIDAAPPYVGPGWDHNDDAVEEVGRDVWRIKLDPRQGVLISTGQRGGIRVVDIQTGEVLWRLDRRMTRHFVHIEFDRGYLLFDRIGSEMEVWKQEDLCNTRTSTRGAFVHYASLFSPRPTRALRFQYPHLALATRDSHVLIWDVERRSIIEEISLVGSMHVEGNINYIDFDDNFVFLVGTGAKCVSVVSRKLGKVIWTLEEHLESDSRSRPTTYVMQAESSHIPAKYASLERRRLKRAYESPWQRAIGRQNWAQRLMLPVQAWSAIHPDFRSRTLVVLGQTNVLLIRDYLTCFSAWESKKERELNAVEDQNSTGKNDLEPDMFVDLRFSEGDEGDPELSWDEMPPSQLAVSESRAMCIVGKPMLIDLDPTRLTRSEVRSINSPRVSDETQIGDPVSDEEAGFAVYNTIESSNIDFDTEDAYLSSLETCSCVMMDSTLCCAVQMHEVAATGPLSPALAMSDYYDVLVWDFAKLAAQRL